MFVEICHETFRHSPLPRSQWGAPILPSLKKPGTRKGCHYNLGTRLPCRAKFGGHPTQPGARGRLSPARGATTIWVPVCRAGPNLVGIRAGYSTTVKIIYVQLYPGDQCYVTLRYEKAKKSLPHLENHSRILTRLWRIHSCL